MSETCKGFIYVPDNGGYRSAFRNCDHLAKRDGFCGIHHPENQAARFKKREAKAKEVLAARNAKWKRQSEDAANAARWRKVAPIMEVVFKILRAGGHRKIADELEEILK